MKELLHKIESRTARVGIVGLGYIGLPMAVAFAKRLDVVGYDTNYHIINSLRQGVSHIWDVTHEELGRCLNKTFHPTNQETELARCDFIIICVPTPLTADKQPDLSCVKGATRTIATILKKGQFVILESTTYPGTTEEVVIPLLEKSGLKANTDFGAAYSLERIDPGNKRYNLGNVPKITAGITPECSDVAVALYKTIVENVIAVRDCRTAEACKMLENTFRMVNIALVNEMALVFEKMGINIWEVIEAAATKPYGFMPFYPGPGIGGHCIPLDPYYMAYKARRCEVAPRLIELSGEVNDFMKIHAVNLAGEGLASVGGRIRNAQIAVLGMAYKKEFNDARESPAVRIIEELVEQGATVRAFDPYVKSLETACGRFDSERSLDDALMGADCAMFLVDHNQFRTIDGRHLKALMGRPVVVDCKNLFEADKMTEVIYLAIGKPHGRTDMTGPAQSNPVSEPLGGKVTASKINEGAHEQG